jgi:K(+)-stimulated pyrophosphate-energized sodium pump
MHGVRCLLVVLGQVSTAPLNASGDDGRIYLWIAMGVGVLALLAAALLARSVLAHETGTEEMQVISNAIREGAEAFLKRQYRTIGILAVVLAITSRPGPRLTHSRPSSASWSAQSAPVSPDSPGCTSRSARTSAPPPPRATA